MGTRWALGGHHLTLLSSWRHYWGLRPPLASLQQIHDDGDGDYYDDDADIVIIIMLSSAIQFKLISFHTYNGLVYGTQDNLKKIINKTFHFSVLASLSVRH